MRKALLAFCLASAVLTGCTDPDKTPMSKEEDFLMNAYAMVMSAWAWDEVCNNGQAAKVNPSMTDNREMIGTQLYNSFKSTRPTTPDTVLKRAVKESGKTMLDQQVKMLKDEGCDATRLAPFKQAFEHYTTTDANQNYSEIMRARANEGISEEHTTPPPAPDRK